MGNTSLADRLLGAGARHHAAALLRRFMRAARDAARVQERLLRRQLALNADSDFGRAHGFAKIRTYDEFVRSVPIQTYEDIRPYVDRVMAGEVNALLGRWVHQEKATGSLNPPWVEWLMGFPEGWTDLED